MRLFKKLKFHQNNSGLTIVELVCAVAIVSLLGITVSSIMMVSANSYRKGNAETTVQQDAQLVANQIDDLIIDSTSDVKFESNVLKITQKDSTGYWITYDATEKSLTYSELNSAGVEIDSSKEVLATGVNSFSADVSKFQTNGFVQLSVTLQNADAVYPAVFTITSRNTSITGGAAATVTAYVKSTVKKWLLEPNQSKDFSPYVTSSVGNTLSWSIEGNTSGLTNISNSGTLTIGGDEHATIIKVRAYDATVSPVKEAFIDVYVRRVNSISIIGTLTSGATTALKENATYNLVTMYTGTALNKINGASYDSDYVSTRTVSYQVTGGTAAGKGEIVSGNILKLTSDFEVGDILEVTATAQHPAGANKSGVSYDTVIAKFTLTADSPLIIDTDDGWKRKSDTPQATIDNAKLDALVQALKDNGYDLDRNKHRYTVDFRPVGVADAEWRHVGSVDKYGADGYGSNAINIRPLISGWMNPLLDYEVLITWEIVDNNDEVIYSFTFGQTVKRISAGFTCSEAFGGTTRYSWGYNERPVFKTLNGLLLTADTTSITGIPAERFQNKVYCLLEKQSTTDPSVWTNVTGKMQYGDSYNIRINQSLSTGIYRIRLAADVASGSGAAFDTDFALAKTVNVNGKSVIDLSDDVTGEGIFYFEVNPSGTSTNVSTPKPTATAKPTATPTPTATADPAASATPSATPTATPSATPTATPIPTPSATPTPTPTAAPEDKPSVIHGALDLYITQYASDQWNQDQGKIVVPIPQSVLDGLQHQYYYGGNINYNISIRRDDGGTMTRSGTVYISSPTTTSVEVTISEFHLDKFQVTAYTVK